MNGRFFEVKDCEKVIRLLYSYGVADPYYLLSRAFEECIKYGHNAEIIKIQGGGDYDYKFELLFTDHKTNICTYGFERIKFQG